MSKEQNIKTIREAVIKAVPEVVELKFGCEVEAYSIGMWMHRASGFFYRVVEEQSLSNKEKERLTEYCGFEPWSKIKLSCIGFQDLYKGWEEQGKYPKSIEVYQSLFPHKNEYKVVELSDVYKGELKIIGRPIRLFDCLQIVDTDEHRLWLAKNWSGEDNLESQSEIVINMLYGVAQ